MEISVIDRKLTDIDEYVWLNSDEERCRFHEDLFQRFLKFSWFRGNTDCEEFYMIKEIL